MSIEARRAGTHRRKPRPAGKAALEWYFARTKGPSVASANPPREAPEHRRVAGEARPRMGGEATRAELRRLVPEAAAADSMGISKHAMARLRRSGKIDFIEISPRKFAYLPEFLENFWKCRIKVAHTPSIESAPRILRSSRLIDLIEERTGKRRQKG